MWVLNLENGWLENCRLFSGKSKQFQSVDSVYVLPIGNARVRLLEWCGVGMSRSCLAGRMMKTIPTHGCIPNRKWKIIILCHILPSMILFRIFRYYKMNGVKEHWLTSSAHLSVQHGCVLDAHSGPSKFRVCSWQFSLSQGPLKAMGWMATPVFRETLAMIFNEILWMVAKSKSPVVRWFIILYHTISCYIILYPIINIYDYVGVAIIC